jgi:hypothetical protein
MMALRTPFLSIIFFYLVGDITFGNAAEVDALAGPFKKSSGACLVEHQVVVADELFGIIYRFGVGVLPPRAS